MVHSIVSCDTFVVLPPLTDRSVTIFAKNSDRPLDEVQEVVYFPEKKYDQNTKVKCTYIEIDQAKETYAIAISKPSWMWGAEMGSNEHNVVIGNEAIYTRETDLLGIEKLIKPGLLGMDLVRLGLERAKTSIEALQVITDLLEKYGQGGLCIEAKESDTRYGNWAYHNSFLIADISEAWVLETIGKHWAAERVTNGFRNLSNCLTIGQNFTKCSAGLKQYAVDQGWWNETDDVFDFKKVFASQKDIEDRSRFEAGKALLKEKTEKKKFTIFEMMEILRDCKSGICRSKESNFPTQSSQISILNKPPNLSSHWFTATPDPKNSIFKPMVFTKNVQLGTKCSLPIQPPSWKHQLYAKHEKMYPFLLDGSAKELSQTLAQLERECILELHSKLNQDESALDYSLLQLGELFEDAVEAEIRFYK